MDSLALLPGHRTLRRLDVVAVTTLVVFLVLGAVAGVSLARLAQLGAGLADVGRSLDLAARAIALLGEVPVVGEAAGRLSDGVAQAAAGVTANGAAVEQVSWTVALTVGTAIALLPVPLLGGAYLPLRRARRREIRGLRRHLAAEVDPMLVEHLARAALARVPYAQLRALTATPWRDVDEGRHDRLAAAELRRLGVAPPPGWDATDTGPPAPAARDTGAGAGR